MDQQENSGQQTKAKQKLSPRTALWIVAILFCVAVIAAIGGILPRVRARTDLREQTNTLAVPTVRVIKPTIGQPQSDVLLPASLNAYTDAPIYAVRMDICRSGISTSALASRRASS